MMGTGRAIYFCLDSTLLFCGPIPAGVLGERDGGRRREQGTNSFVLFDFLKIMIIQMCWRQSSGAGCCIHLDSLDFSQDD